MDNNALIVNNPLDKRLYGQYVRSLLSKLVFKPIFFKTKVTNKYFKKAIIVLFPNFPLIKPVFMIKMNKNAMTTTNSS